MFNPNLLYLDNPVDSTERVDQEIEEHRVMKGRLQKSLYYGKYPKVDRPSLPLTNIAVEQFRESCPRKLGKLDMHNAAHVTRNACVSPCGLMLSMLYLKRLKGRNPDYLQKVSSSDAFLISMMVASKYLYDEGSEDEVFNDEWAESGNMDMEELNEQERNFLQAIGWNLFVKEDEFETLLDTCEKRIALSQGLDRGWFSYMDLCVLSNARFHAHLVKMVLTELSKVVIVCSVAYVAGVLTLVGSTVLVSHLTKAGTPNTLLDQGIPQPPSGAKDHVESGRPIGNDSLHENEPQESVQTNKKDSFYQGIKTHKFGAFSDPFNVDLDLITLAMFTDVFRYASQSISNTWDKVCKSLYVAWYWKSSNGLNAEVRSRISAEFATTCHCSQGPCLEELSQSRICFNTTVPMSRCYAKVQHTDFNHNCRTNNQEKCSVSDCNPQYCCCYGNMVHHATVFSSIVDVPLGFSTGITTVLV